MIQFAAETSTHMEAGSVAIVMIVAVILILASGGKK